jgi:hypothetical protein
MKKTNEVSIDAKGIKVLSIILFGLIVTLVCVLISPEEPNLLLPGVVNGLSAVALNRIMGPPQKNIPAEKFKVLRAISEVLFVLGAIGVLMVYFLYSEWFTLFPILMAPAFVLSLYLVIHSLFGEHPK